MRLLEKVAIVTGAGSGIGRATAELFAQEGADVVVADFRADAAMQVVQSILAKGGDAIFAAVDVSIESQVVDMVELARKEYGRIDVLVNAAGILKFGTVLETTKEDWERLLSVNLTGTFLCCKEAIPIMKEHGGGSIVNISSSTGSYAAGRNSAAYVASKGGVALLTKAMAADHASDNIRVNAIAPGPTDTAMLRENMSTDAVNRFAETFPMMRLGKPEEIACAALFLACGEASFVTGAVLSVDGGQTAEI